MKGGGATSQAGGISEVMRGREAELAGMLTGRIATRFGKRQVVNAAIEEASGDRLLQAILRSRAEAQSV